MIPKWKENVSKIDGLCTAFGSLAVWFTGKLVWREENRSFLVISRVQEFTQFSI